MKFQNLCKIILISACLVISPAFAQDEDDAGAADSSATPAAEEQAPSDTQSSSDLSKEIDEATGQDKSKNSVPEPEVAKPAVGKKVNKPAPKKAMTKKQAKHAAKKAKKKNAKSKKGEKAHSDKKKH